MRRPHPALDQETASRPGPSRLALLGGRAPDVFMRTYWQRRPLLIRQAVDGPADWLDRKALFEMAARDDVESRLIVRDDRLRAGWSLRHGPFGPRALPSRSRAAWTLLVQGVDLHVPAAHELLHRFHFVPQARLDDVMVSYAAEGGGVGPHTDNYDVFLLQLHGRRRWRWGPARDPSLVPDVPLKLLSSFEPRHEAVLEPGDMLYLPPHQAHDGVAVDGDCMTCSVGFRAPTERELAREILARLADDDARPARDRRYGDAGGGPAARAAAVPGTLAAFARAAVARATADAEAIERALGEYLSEPKSNVWFDPADRAPRRAAARAQGLRLDRRTRMLYDAYHVYLNGESYRVGGRDARLLRHLADGRALDARAVATGSDDLRESFDDWCRQGWMFWEAA